MSGEGVVFLTRDGHLAFAGTPSQARRYFGIDDLVEVYRLLASEMVKDLLEAYDAWAKKSATNGARP